MINLFTPVPSATPTTVLGDSVKLNPKDMVKTMNDMFVIMVPKSSRAIRGEVNIKKYLYKDVTNPFKDGKKEEDFTDEDKEMLERFRAVKKVSAVIKSFLPDQYKNELFDYQYQVRKAFKEHCISPNLSYMTREASEHFKSFVKEIVQRQDQTLTRICSDWDLIEDEFKRQLALAVKGITDDEMAKAMCALPTPEQFKASYDNTFVFQTMGFDNCTTEIDFRSDKIKTAQEVAEEDFKEIIGGAMAETMNYLDIVSVAIAKGEIAPRTKALVPDIHTRLREKTIFTGNIHIEAIAAKCELMPQYLNDADALPELVEDIATDIYYLLDTYQMTSHLNKQDYQVLKMDDLKVLSQTKNKKAS